MSRALVAIVLTACAAPAARTCPPLPAAAPPAPRDVGVRWRATGAGPALVLIHGNFDSLETWDRVAPALAARFRVITLDLPGFGEREHHGATSVDAMAISVLRVMDAAGVDRAIVAGNSYGGAVAATVAIDAPERVAGLVLEDANFVPSEPDEAFVRAFMPAWQAAIALAEAPADAGRRATLRERIKAALAVALVHPGAIDDALVDHFTDGFTGHRLDAVRGANQARFDDLAPRLIAVRRDHPFPVLVLWGANDPLIPVTAAQDTLDWLPDARLVLLGGVGHAPHLEVPERFVAAVIGAFVERWPERDAYVADANGAALPASVGGLPRVALPVLRALAQPTAEERFGLALDALASGAPDEAAAIAASLDEHAAGFRAFLAGAQHELGGAPSADDYAAALRDLPDAWRPFAMLRLARQPLAPEVGAALDAALARGPEASAIVAAARVDRALITGRYADALATIATLPGDPQLARLRRMWADAGLGRFGDLRAEARAFDQLEETATVPPALGGIGVWRECGASFAAIADASSGHLAFPDGCAALGGARAIASWMPPPPVERLDAVAPALAWTPQAWQTADQARAERARLTAALGGDASPLAVLARARLALYDDDLGAAATAVAALPDDALAQAPEPAAIVLAVRAARGDRKAVATARALAAAHPDDAAWQRALGVAQLAAGRYADAATTLERALALAPDDAVRAAMVWADAGAGRVPDARALDRALAAHGDWAGTWVERLPAASRLAAVVRPRPAESTVRSRPTPPR